MTGSHFSHTGMPEARPRVQVGPLRVSSGQEVNEAGAMAEVFNDQFSSVFTDNNVVNISLPENIVRGAETDRLLAVMPHFAESRFAEPNPIAPNPN